MFIHRVLVGALLFCCACTRTATAQTPFDGVLGVFDALLGLFTGAFSVFGFVFFDVGFARIFSSTCPRACFLSCVPCAPEYSCSKDAPISISGTCLADPIIDSPSESPTQMPSAHPTERPSTSPSESPTQTPSAQPTEWPSTSPSESPTQTPIAQPTTECSSDPICDEDGFQGECTTVAMCRELYPGADDCNNSDGGVCFCGDIPCGCCSNKVCEEDTDRFEGECVTTLSCRELYPGADNCNNVDGGICFCGDIPCGCI